MSAIMDQGVLDGRQKLPSKCRRDRRAHVLRPRADHPERKTTVNDAQKPSTGGCGVAISHAAPIRRDDLARISRRAPGSPKPSKMTRRGRQEYLQIAQYDPCLTLDW